ncbi:permease of the drug/metabolite transporter (DMT) superfamily [Clostridium aceticum]|uniref:Permease of the drug/metabolite transporter (DMT) superfamily n=1 Tax=Clostridium aceticum TaxID=84022 RepID=A0A0D8I8P8_9CLOT|nr:DMT family transporter [Clostridium aceticum]AKL96269.1 permease of the drug/metabolite transporter (DMT) superfamily [Clostridium aceticum]KJF26670.1 permease [Clostridium aceticum]
MDQENQYLPIAAGIFVAIIFGFSFLFTKAALDLLSPFHLLGFRFAFATITLLLLQVLKIIKINLLGKGTQMLLFLALFQPLLYFICETLGVSRTSASEAGMMIALIPIVVTILAAIFLGEKPTKLQLVFICLSVVGVIFIIAMTGNIRVGENFVGMFILLGAVFSAGVFNVMSRKSSLHFKPVEITYVMMWVGVIVFNTIAVLQHINQGNLMNYFEPLKNMKVFVSIAYLGVLSSVGAFFMLNFMLAKVEASKAAVFTNLITVISIIGGVVFRNEHFYWFHGVGAFMILLGVWGTNYFEKQKTLYEIRFDTIRR